MSAPRRLVIVGRDAPLWLSACVLQYGLAPAGVDVTVIELPPRAQPADLCIAMPSLEPLHARLRIDEARLVAATRATFSLGRRFVDTVAGTPAFFHAHGSVGSRIDRKEFLPHWLRARELGALPGFEEFSLTAAAAKRGRMLLPDAAVESFGFTDYGYHLPAIAYGAWLRHLATRRGARVSGASELGVRRDAQGNIAGLQLDGGRTVDGDFFVDVSGRDALLAGTLGAGRESWRDSFPVDRVLTAHSALLAPVPVYSEIRAHATGWVSLAASQVCMHVQQAYCSDLAAEPGKLDAASLPLNGVVVREHHPGRLLRAWQHNCVAIGEAACVFDPVHFVELHAVQLGLVHLLPLFPVQANCDVERDEYNQNVRAGYSRLRDFQAAHYHLNRYGESAFWSRARAKAPNPVLAHKIRAFRARGEAVDYENEAFHPDDWRQLLIGHGVIPESWDPAADLTPAEVLEKEMRRILGFIRRKVEEQPAHQDHLRARCTPGV